MGIDKKTSQEDTGAAIGDNDIIRATQGGSSVKFFFSMIKTWFAAATVTLTNKTIDASSNAISNLTTATFAANAIDTDGTFAANSDARLASQKAIKTYVDSVAQGLDPKPSVKAATTANITLSGTQTVDGVALVANDRCLVKNQTTPSQNGAYVVAAGAWSRAPESDSWSELPGSYMWVEQGTINGDTGWVCTVDQGGTLGTTAIAYVQFGGAGTYSAGSGLSLSGTQFSIGANGVTNAMLAQGGGATLKGNATASTANVGDFTIQGLTDIATPSTTLDWLPIYNHTTGTLQKTNASELVAAIGGGVTTLNAATGTLTLSDTGGGVVSTSGTAITIASRGGMLNKFRNGTMDIWQRGTAAITVATASAYAADGWIVTPTGASCTAQQASNNRTGANTLFGLQLTGATSVTDIQLTQRIESYVAAALAGKTVTVQAQIFNSTGGSITPTLTTKSAGTTDVWSSPTTDLSATSLQACANGVWTQISYTLSVSANATKGYEFIFDFGNNFSTTGKNVVVAELDVRVASGVSTGLNSAPPPPELRPIANELSFCQRYFVTDFSNGATPANIAQLSERSGLGYLSGNVAAYLKFPASMRAVPSLSYFSPSGTGVGSPTAGQWNALIAGTWVQATGITTISLSASEAMVASAVTGAVAGSAYIFAGSFAASAEL